jgi:hypothetical protein
LPIPAIPIAWPGQAMPVRPAGHNVATVTTGFGAEDELRFRLRGGLYGPGAPEYADACARVEHQPRLVARCVAPEDVITVLAFARERGLPIAVLADGRTASGYLPCHDGLVLDLRGWNA